MVSTIIELDAHRTVKMSLLQFDWFGPLDVLFTAPRGADAPTTEDAISVHV